jgi:hypothetical protein
MQQEGGKAGRFVGFAPSGAELAVDERIETQICSNFPSSRLPVAFPRKDVEQRRIKRREG